MFDEGVDCMHLLFGLSDVRKLYVAHAVNAMDELGAGCFSKQRAIHALVDLGTIGVGNLDACQGVGGGIMKMAIASNGSNGFYFSSLSSFSFIIEKMRRTKKGLQS